MADLFSVTAPLTIQHPDGHREVMAAVFPHDRGIMFFRLFWDLIEQNQGIENAFEIIEGDIKGEGPWKVGQHIVNVLACHGGDPHLATQFSQWQMHYEQQGYTESSKEMLRHRAIAFGAEA